MIDSPAQISQAPEVEVIARRYEGVLFIGDPHVASYAPGHRRDDYCRSVLDKLRYGLGVAQARDLLPVVLGDLFHVPRNNPNHLLVDLMEMFAPVIPWVLVGNHDKHEARLTRDVSLWVLHAAGVIRLLDEGRPPASLTMGGRKVLLGASPDWVPIPKTVDRIGHDHVLWVTHHDLAFPGYDEARFRLREISGVDLVVNGHIHTPKEPVPVGGTLWVNPGSLTRITRSRYTRDMKPQVVQWTPASGSLQFLEVPHLPFEEVFPPLSEDDEDTGTPLDESLFIRGLENLALRKTTEGVGLRAFLEANLIEDDPLNRVIWDLYEEVMKDAANE